MANRKSLVNKALKVRELFDTWPEECPENVKEAVFAGTLPIRTYLSEAEFDYLSSQGFALDPDLDGWFVVGLPS